MNPVGDPLEAAKGILAGLALSILLWVVIILVFLL